MGIGYNYAHIPCSDVYGRYEGKYSEILDYIWVVTDTTVIKSIRSLYSRGH